MVDNHTPNIERLSAYLDGQLPNGEREELERHLKSCVLCAEELHELRSTVVLLKALPLARAPRSFTLDARAVAPRRSPWIPKLRWASIALSLVLMLTVGLDLAAFTSPESLRPGTMAEQALPATSGAAPTVAAGAMPTSASTSAAAMATSTVASAAMEGMTGGAEPSATVAAAFVPTSMAQPTAQVADPGATSEPKLLATFPPFATPGIEEDASTTLPDEQPQLDATTRSLAAIDPPGYAFARELTASSETHNFAVPIGTLHLSNGDASNKVISEGESTTYQSAGGQGSDLQGQEARTRDEPISQAETPAEPSEGAQAWLLFFELLVGALLAASLVALLVLSRRS